MPKAKIDVYQEITDRIIAALEDGTRPWTKSWSVGSGNVPLRVNGEPYRGINVFLLMMEGRSAQTWMTYKQAQELGGQVRKGERSAMVTFFKILKKEQDDGSVDKIPLIRYYNVFNVEQIDGLPERFYPQPAEVRNADERDAGVDAYVAATGATVNHGGDKAYFAPGPDAIQLPLFEQFNSAEDYYAVELHELVHWSGHKSRLDRHTMNSFGSAEYAKEELVAEMGAAILCATLGVSAEPREDHASYIASWLKALKNDKKFVFQAATAAQKAVDHLEGYQALDMEEAA